MIRRLLRILVFLVGGGVLLLLGLYLALLKTPLLKDGINNWVKERDYPLKVKIEKIKGNLLSEIKLEGVEGEIERTGSPPSPFQVKEVRLRYSLSDLLRGKKRVREVFLKEPHLTLKARQGGAHHSARDGDPPFPPMLFQKITIKNGSLQIATPKGSFTFQRIELALPSISFEGERVKGEVRDLSFDLLERKFHLKTLRGMFALRNDSLLLSGITLVTSRSNLLISGSISGFKDPEFSLDITGNKLNLNEMDRLANLGGILSGSVKTSLTAAGKLRDFQGKAVIDGLFLGNQMKNFTTKYRWKGNVLHLGRAEGIYFKALMRGTGWLNFSTSPPTYSADISLFGLDLTEVVKSPLTTDLNGRVKMEGKGLRLNDLGLDFQVDLREARIQGIPTDTVRGKIFVDKNSIVFFPGFQTYLQGTFASWEGDISFKGETNISGEIKASDLSFMEEIYPLPGWQGRPLIDFRLQGDIKDPNLIANLTICYLNDSLFAAQRVRGEVKLSNILSQRQGWARFRADSIEIKGFKWRSLSLCLRFHGNSVYFDSLRVEGQELSFSGKGSFQREKGKGTLLVEEVTGQYRGTNFSSQRPFVVILLPNMVSFGEVFLQTKEGTILCSGMGGKGKDWNLSLRVDDLRLGSILRDVAPQAEGYLTANLDLNLRSSSSFSGKFEVREGRWGGFKFKSLSSSINYGDSLLSLEGLVCQSGGSSYLLNAAISLYISLQPPDVKVLDKRLNLSLEGKGDTFTLPYLWTDLIEECKGDFHLWGEVDGSPRRPKLSGGLAIQSGKLKIKGIKNRFNGFDLDLALKGNTLVVNRMEMQSVGRGKGDVGNIFHQLWRTLSGRKREEPGWLKISGDIDLSQLKYPDFKLKIEANRFPILLVSRVPEAIFDGSLQLVGQRPPLLQGRILAHKLVYQFPPSWSAPGGGGNLPFSLNLELTFPQNLWVKNPQATIELGGDLRLSSVDDRLRVLGDLTLRRGEYFLYGSTFHISSGLINFEESPELNPRIEIEGRTEVGNETILLTVKGTLREPLLSFDSTPHHYPQEDILALLAVHQTPTGIDTLGAGKVLAPRATDFFTSYLEHELEKEIAKSLQVETLQIKANQEKELDLAKVKITVGKYISNRIYLQYSRRLSMSSGQEVGIDYRLSRLFYLEGVRDQKGLYRFSLNLKWNY